MNERQKIQSELKKAQWTVQRQKLLKRLRRLERARQEHQSADETRPSKAADKRVVLNDTAQ